MRSVCFKNAPAVWCGSSKVDALLTSLALALPILLGGLWLNLLVPPETTARNRTSDLNAPGAIISTVTSFGEDAEGEIYIVDRGGEIFKILPTLSLMELSESPAPGVAAQGNGDWTWESLGATSGHPVSSYKVYRSDTGPAGMFNCVHESADASWIGGDPAVPPTGGNCASSDSGKRLPK